MASKSKKRRRVFRASCILAALIIAGSSFAWFTSKDEVTNRLSASGDYDVRIVESFAPPANWLPGQEVNKDVYAVNTGDVEAFVEETVSGTLTITREKAYTGTNNKPDADSIELSAAERYAIEAGSYLAYAPTNSNLKPGTKVVAMTPDFNDENGYTSAKATDFTPDAAGLYVFRRVIDYPDANNGQIETFEYDAYYYVPGMDSAVEQKQVQGDDGNGNSNAYKWTKHKIDQSTPEADTVAWTDDQTAPVEPGYTFTPVMETVQQQKEDEDGHKVYKNKTTGLEQAFETAPDAAQWDPVMEDVTAHEGIDGKFYKVSNLHVTPDTTLDLAGDNVHTDGNLTAATAGFYKDVTETFDPTALKYEEAVTTGDNQHPKRLVVTYDLKAKDYVNLDNLADAYDDALVEFEVAMEEYNAALRDLTKTDPKGTNALLTDATNALQTALDNMRAAENAKAAAEKLVADTLAARNVAQEALTAAQGKQADAQTAYNKALDDYNNALIADNAAGTALTNATNALGTKDDPIGGTTAWAKYKKAAKDVEDAEDSAREAFLTYLINTNTAPLNTVTDRDEALDYLAAVSYDELNGLGISNTEVGYNYWKLVVAEKKAKEDLEDAQTAYDDANTTKTQTAKALADAETAKDNAETALTNATSAVGDGSSGAQKDYNDANTAYQDALTALGGEGDAASDAAGASAWAKYNKAAAELETARTAYDDALEKVNTDKTQLKAAEQKYANAAQTLSEAEKAYNEAVAENDGKINIFVNLSDDVITAQPDPALGDKWQLVPTSLVDTDGDNKADTARFYYTSILGGGETSAKLIDSVELDSAVTQDMFKYLDFDLNVALKSAQIAMDSDGETILTTAADTILDADATLAQPTNIDTAITWTGSAAATPKTYQAAASSKATSNDSDYEVIDGGVVVTKLDTPVTFDGKTYIYKIVSGGKTYYGDGLASDSVFQEATGPDDGNYTSVANSTIKLTSDAAGKNATGFNVSGNPVRVEEYTTEGDLKDDGYRYQVVIDAATAATLGKDAGTYVSKTETGDYELATTVNTVDSTKKVTVVADA